MLGMNKLVGVAVLLVLGLVGCGGQTDPQGGAGTGANGAAAGNGGSGGSGAEGGSAGSGAIGGNGGQSGSSGSAGNAGNGGSAGNGATAGSAGNAGTGGLPDECAVPSNEPGPYTVTFHFVNVMPSPLFLREDCLLTWSLYSCADGYNNAVSHAADCTMSCTEPHGCVECGACLENAIAVDAGAPHDATWTGITYTFGQNLDGCTCYNDSVAPAGKYQIRVPVYASEQDAIANNVAYEVTQAFDLSSSQIVEVQLALLELPID